MAFSNASRFLVQDVFVKRDRDGHEIKQIYASSPQGGQLHLISLHDDWAYDTVVRSGDTITVVGSFQANDLGPTSCPTLDVTSGSNAIVVRPEILVPVTTVSGSFSCLRRSILSKRIRSASHTATSSRGLTAAQYGILLHSIVQNCLRSATLDNGEAWDEDFIHVHARAVVFSKAGIDACFSSGLSQPELLIDLQERMSGMLQFSRTWFGPTPKVDAVVENDGGLKTLLAITGVDSVEKVLRSNMLGLSGQVDAIARLLVVQESAGTSTVIGRYIAPLEIKTGRALANPPTDHTAQALLYAMILQSLHSEDTYRALLCYTSTASIFALKLGRNEIRGLLQARNTVAEWLEPRPVLDHGLITTMLPDPVDSPVHCTRCSLAHTCTLYRKSSERFIPVPADMEDLVSSRTAHLSMTHTSFFRTWDRLLALEDYESRTTSTCRWTVTRWSAIDDANHAAFLDDLVYQDIGSAMDTSTSNVLVVFRRFDDGRTLTRMGSFSLGDDVVVEAEDDSLANVRGSIAAVYPDSIVVSTAESVPHPVNSPWPGARERNVVFRIARAFRGLSITRCRDNISRLFTPTHAQRRRRELIVDLVAPTFDYPDGSRPHEPSSLDVSQRAALDWVLRAQDYAIVRGTPGSGKTTLVVAIIMTLVAAGKTVLLTSQTHSALDSVLVKLVQAPFGVLRLGPKEKVHPLARVFCLLGSGSATSAAEYEHQLLAPPVVAATCHSFEHPIFGRRRFNYCIVDEATQLTLPLALGPIHVADKFVLVGDEHQLGPLVLSDAARQHGLGESLFQYLVKAHPEAVIELNQQYRMGSDIMSISNRLTYGSRVTCGSQSVADRQLDIPRPLLLRSLHVEFICGRCWLDEVLDPRRSVIFLDTDQVPAKESSAMGLVQNEIEAVLVSQVIHAAISCGVPPARIGVISPYHQQLLLVSRMLQTYADVELLTVDQSQGRENECYVVSLVRSNDTGEVGSLLRDPSRVNVALTRARSKLILIGSKTTLQFGPYMRMLFELLDSKGWVYTLPPTAQQCYARPS